MQLDMHYYGTYAMARAAGIIRAAAKIIATASQFVDDNAVKESIEFEDGGFLVAEATAHHAYDLKNLAREDQRHIWVPFHFLPGNEGESYTERLVCRKNSTIAREMVQFNLSQIDQPYGLHLVGVTAHVYADTFSHYGFSGVSSRCNKIDNDSFEFGTLDPQIKDYIEQKAQQFREKYPDEEGFLANIKSWLAETASGALGHAAAATYPDRPYLAWSFIYENTGQRCPTRDNQQTFLEGCEALYTMFRQVAEKRADLSEDGYVPFNSIEAKVLDILRLQANKEGRIAAWQDAAKKGELFAGGGEEIPVYDGEIWLDEREDLNNTKNSDKVPEASIYQFYQAASIHRLHVLRKLLPAHGLVVA